MRITFVNEALRTLCNSRARLNERFGADADVVELRLMALHSAPRLLDITARPPDRRRFERIMGEGMLSVCARGAGRIYFKADSVDGSDEALDEATAIQITLIGWRN